MLIVTDRGRFLLKRRASGRDHPMKVLFSHQVQQFLADQGFPLPQLVLTRQGDDTMVTLDDRIYEIFHFIEGNGYRGTLDGAYDAGRVLGQFHRLVAGFRNDWEPSRRGYHDAANVRNNLNSVPAGIGKDDSVVGKESELLTTITNLFECYDSAADRVNESRYAEWPKQIVHADWHPSNMLFEDEAVRAVVDYDSLRLLPPVTDLANGALQFSIKGGPVDPRQWPSELDEERFRQFLLGYEQEGTVSADQIRAIPALMIEALIAEAVMPIAATGSFGRLEGFRFLQMISRKVRWLEQNGDRLMSVVQV
jgi:Ser/Thr protein kinase RdoA (MazF antagonist)